MSPIALREHYSQVIEEIRADVIRMGGRTSELVKLSVEAALNGDLEIAQRVIKLDDEIDELEANIHRRAVMTVLQEAPVAADFRFLVSSLGLVGEIEKAADDAVKLARRARKLSGNFPAEMKVSLMELGEESRRVFNTSLRLFTDYSHDLADEIITGDEQIDTRYTVARNRVIDLIRCNPEDSENLVRTIDCFHALEHVADHAVEIARRLKMLYEPPLRSSPE